MNKNDHILCEQVWGNDDFNPFEIKVEIGQEGIYGSYLSGLPEYGNPELQEYYSQVKEYSQWAIENKVCLKCRFPWVGIYKSCDCGKYEANKAYVDAAEISAMKILDYDRQQVLSWAKKMEEDLQGDSEYARLNRKAREIMQKRIARYRVENQPQSFMTKILQKRTWRNLWVRASRWLSPSYWKWILTTPKAERVKSIPLQTATAEDVKELSFGNQKVQSGNVLVRTKSGIVVVVPAAQINDWKHHYKDATIVEPIVKD